MEEECMGLPEATSAFKEEDGEELELGLSLGTGKVTAGKNKAGCRILTASDFPTSRGSRDSLRPPSSSSSSVSSSASLRVVADHGELDCAGSANPPSNQAVVGWPPIRAFRINNLVNQTKDINADAIADTKNSLSSSSNEGMNAKNQETKIGNLGITRFVKVNMDGNPIGRKVDLKAHRSYETLASALELMFHNPTIDLSSLPHGSKVSKKLLDGSSDFALTYEDKDGDWMLVGDVPWRMFLDTVKRIRIMRTSDANGLAPGFQSLAGGQLGSKPA